MQVSATAQVVLEGIPLPVRKEIVVEYAERQDAPPDVLAALRAIPDIQYMRIDDIGEAIQAVQPAFAPPDVHTPKVESGDVPGGEAYLSAGEEPGWIRDNPRVLEYEPQLVRTAEAEPGGGIPQEGEEAERPGGKRPKRHTPLDDVPHVGE
jgi:hypothetical protein